MRFQYLLLTLGATLSAAAHDRGQCYSIGQMYPSTDRVSGRSECCPDGTEYNGNICEALPTCFNPDEYFDTVDRVCRAKKDCGDGNYFYIRERKCKPIPLCLDDEFFDGQYCVRKPQCQDGFYFEKTGCVPKPRCEDDEWFDGRNCVEKPQDCGAGKHWDFKANQCVPNPPVTLTATGLALGVQKDPSVAILITFSTASTACLAQILTSIGMAMLVCRGQFVPRMNITMEAIARRSPNVDRVSIGTGKKTSVIKSNIAHSVNGSMAKAVK